MRLKYIDAIHNQCKGFMDDVIDIVEALPKNMLMARLDSCDCEYRESGDDTIDVDYKDMLFTIYKNNSGKWGLCENATYYVYDDTKQEIFDSIDVEL